MSIDWDRDVLGPLHKVFGNATVSLQPAAGGLPFDVGGIFDRGYRQVVVLEDGTEAFTSASPVLGVRVAACPVAPVQSDQLTITAVTEGSLQDLVGSIYVIREVRPDSKGEARLMLNLVGRL